MKRTTLWTVVSVSLVVSAIAWVATAQTNDEKLSRKEVGEILAQSRSAIKQGKLNEAERLLKRAESAGVNYGIFYPGDTPKKVRRTLNKAHGGNEKSVASRIPNPLNALTGSNHQGASDPFAQRKQAIAAGDGTALPGPNAYPTRLPATVVMPTPPPIDQANAALAQAPTGQPIVNPYIAPVGQADRYAGGGVQLASGNPPSQLQVTPAVTVPRVAMQTATPEQIAAVRGVLQQARLALSVGDTQSARRQLQQAKALNVALPEGQDNAHQVEAAIVRYEQIMVEQPRLGNDPAWRRQYGTVLVEQAAALIEHGILDDAERMVTDASKLGVSFGPYDVTPAQVMRQIEAARKKSANTTTLVDTTVDQSAMPTTPTGTTPTGTTPAGTTPAGTTPAGTSNPADKDRAIRLLAAARAALAGGDVKQAEQLVNQATGLGVEPTAYGAADDRPELVRLDIEKAKMARAQRQATASGDIAAAGRPQLDLAVQQSLYTGQPTGLVSNAGGVTQAGGQVTAPIIPLVAQAVPRPAPMPPSGGSPLQDVASTDAAQLLAEGEAALAVGNKEEALRLFEQAITHRTQLNPIAAQRLQQHLQMLSSTALPNPSGSVAASAPAGSGESEQTLIRQLSADLTRAQSEARRVRESSPKRALDVLAEAQELINKANINPSAKSQLLRRVELSVADTESFIDQNRAQLELDAKNREVLAEVDRRRQARIAMQQKIAELVDEFNKMQEEQRYEEMEIIAARMYELAPDDAVVQTAHTTAKMYRRSRLNDMLASEKERRVWEELKDVEDSSIPFEDNRPIQYGDGWNELSGSRLERHNRERNRFNERELEIQRKLRMPVPVNYVNRPLQDVIQDLARISGVEIVLDPYGLDQEAIRSDTPVTLPLQNEVSLKSALNLILKPLRLDYVIEDEVLKVTSEQRAQGAIEPVVYDVADLVMPIPNFMPGSSTGLQGLINDAHATASGHWLGGGSPTVVVSNDRTGGGEGQTIAQRELMAQQMQGIPGFGGAGLGASPQGPTVPITSGPGPLGGGTQADFDSLIELITSTVHADSWEAVGGPGAIQPFPTNLSLVISQTQEVHEEIADLLTQLRRLQDLQVTIEVRFITLSDNFFEQIGVDFDFLVEDGPTVIPQLAGGVGAPQLTRVEGRRRSSIVGITPPLSPDLFPTFTSDLDVPFTQDSFNMIAPQFGTPVNVAQFGFAILSDLEAYFIIQAAQGDRRSNVLEAPKVTLFNGQFAFVQDTSQRPFVVSVIPVVGDFAAAQQPVIVVLAEGTQLSIQAVVSEDRRYVRLTVVPFFSQIGNVEEFTFEGSTTSVSGSSGIDDDDDGNDEESANNMTEIRSGTTVQLPTFTVVSVATTVSVPDGGTVLLGGIKRLREGRNEFGVPLLSKIPYVNRLFRNVGIGRETQSLMMMVTPRIIIQQEEEQRLLGTLP